MLPPIKKQIFIFVDCHNFFLRVLTDFKDEHHFMCLIILLTDTEFSNDSTIKFKSHDDGESVKIVCCHQYSRIGVGNGFSP